MAHGALVGEIGDLERARGVVRLARPDGEAVVVAQERAERDQIFRKTPERIHQPRGADTDPNPKSVSRP